MSKCILILETNEGLARTLANVFEIGEYSVTVALDLSQAWEALERQEFDCVLMNCQGGRHLVDKMLSLMSATLPRMPRVVLLNAPGEEVVWMGKAMPSVFLPVPDSFDKLFRAFEGTRSGKKDRGASPARDNSIRE